MISMKGSRWIKPFIYLNPTFIDMNLEGILKLSDIFAVAQDMLHMTGKITMTLHTINWEMTYCNYTQ